MLYEKQRRSADLFLKICFVPAQNSILLIEEVTVGGSGGLLG